MLGLSGPALDPRADLTQSNPTFTRDSRLLIFQNKMVLQKGRNSLAILSLAGEEAKQMLRIPWKVYLNIKRECNWV